MVIGCKDKEKNKSAKAYRVLFHYAVLRLCFVIK